MSLVEAARLTLQYVILGKKPESIQRLADLTEAIYILKMWNVDPQDDAALRALVRQEKL